MWDRRTCVRAHGRDTCELHKSRREHAISCYYLILLSVDIVSKVLYEIKITTSTIDNSSMALKPTNLTTTYDDATIVVKYITYS